LPTIDLLFGGYWVEVLVSDYVREEGDGTCTFNFRYRDEAILGTAFMKNYYVVLDVDNQEVGFAPLATLTPKNALVAGVTPWCKYWNEDCQYYGNEFKTFPWVQVIVWTGLIVLPAFALYWFFFRMLKPEDLAIIIVPNSETTVVETAPDSVD
jgi:hypothetical protein